MFADNVVTLALEFEKLTKRAPCDLCSIREFVKARDYQISDDTELFKRIVAAFVCVLRDQYGQRLRVAGIFKKHLEVTSPGYSADLLDLFHRCVFEGLDLAPEGESLARPKE